MKYVLFILAAVAAVTLTAQAITINVPGDYPTIQAGIDAAVDGDTVLVAPDTYHETINFSGKEIIVRSEDPLNTIIDGDSSGTVVMIISGEGPGTVLEGFTITDGCASPGIGSAGVHIATGASPTIKGNIINDNGYIWSAAGGGISVNEANPIIEMNQITNNACIYEGGGIHLVGCLDAVVRNNTIVDNYVCSGYGVSAGVGIYMQNSTALIENNIIVSNVGEPPSYGGGLYLISPSTAEADFNDLWNNTPLQYVGCSPGDYDISEDPLFVGGAPYCYWLTGDSPCIDRGSFTADLDPDGTRPDMGAYYYDQVSVNVAIVPDEWPVVIPAAGGSFSYTVHLTNNTPNQAEFDVWVDARMPDGTIVGPLILRQDIVFSPGQQLERSITQSVPGGAMSGTYYYMIHTGDYNTSTVYHETIMPFVKDGSAGAGGEWAVTPWWTEASPAFNAIQPNEIVLDLKANPNPFNPITTLRFTLPASDYATLKVYDLAGRTVVILLDRNLEMGAHAIRFDGGHLASGVYVAVLQQGAQQDIQRILLMK